MNLFDRIPGRLFSVLASPGRAMYADILLLIYRLFRQVRFLDRELVVDEITDYLTSAQFNDETFAELVEPDGDERQKAQGILRRFKEDGWLDIEPRPDYREFIILYDYAEPILEVLEQVRSPQSHPSVGHIYNAFAALTAEGADEQGALALGEAYQSTDRLMRQLTVLLHNIRHHTERLLEKKKPQDILAMHFTEYQEQILDRSYHQLRTSDHVSKYRPQILAQVETWTQDQDWVAVVGASEAERLGISLEAAREEVLRQLDFIHSSYKEIDGLLAEIDRRNTQYARASLERVRYQLSNNQDVAGQLKQILVHVGDALMSGRWLAQAADSFAAQFNLYPVQTYESSSLYRPRNQRRPHDPEPLMEDPVDEIEVAAARERARQWLATRVTPQKVECWLLARMGNQSQMQASDLGICSTEDLVLLLYLGAWGRSKKLGVTVTFGENRAESVDGHFRFPNMTIHRR